MMGEFGGRRPPRAAAPPLLRPETDARGRAPRGTSTQGIQRVEPEEVERHGLQFQPSADGKDAPAVPVETGQWQAPAAGTVPMVLVDDITGGGPDVGPFRFKHGGWSLYPMDNGAEENQAFSTLAVFVAESDEEEEEG